MIIFSLIITFFVAIISSILIYIKGFNFYLESFILIYMFSGFLITLISLLYFYAQRNKKLKLIPHIKKNKETLYYRDPPFSYSPVIITYLENLNLEIDKDIIAELLFLSQKGYLYFEKTDYNNYILIKNNKTYSSELLASQKFILSNIESGMNLLNFIKLMHKDRKILEHLYEEDCYKLGYLKKLKDVLKNDKLEKFLIISFFMPFLFLLICTIVFFTIQSIFIYNVIICFFYFYVIFLLGFIPSLGIAFLIQIIFDRIILIRTSKAEEDYSKWLTFKDFLIDYTLIKNYNLESLNVLEHYLTYSVALGVTKIQLK